MDAFSRIDYRDLNARQKESYNFQKVAARLADYGFNCIRLTDDWQGADFIASHIDGETFLKVQLKARLTIHRKYIGKSIFIAFGHGHDWYLYPHDDFAEHAAINGSIDDTKSWSEHGSYTWPSPPKWALDKLEGFRL